MCPLQNLAENNAELEKKIEEMKEELKAGRIEIERTTDDHLKLKVSCRFDECQKCKEYSGTLKFCVRFSIWM